MNRNPTEIQNAKNFDWSAARRGRRQREKEGKEQSLPKSTAGREILSIEGTKRPSRKTGRNKITHSNI